jgi:hypothetical protein
MTQQGNRPGKTGTAPRKSADQADPDRKGSPVTNLQQNATGSQPSPNGEARTKGYDPFDPEALRVNSAVDFEVEHVLTTVPVRKPKRTEFFRVHPGPDYVVDMHLLERDTGMEKESYLVTPEVKHLVVSELRPVRLFTAISKHGTVFLWPVKLPRDENDNLRRISDSALQGAEQARTLWTKVVWNGPVGAYELFKAKGDLGEPQWPDKVYRDLIEIAFRGNVIDRADHEVIRELSGEI